MIIDFLIGLFIVFAIVVVGYTIYYFGGSQGRWKIPPEALP